MTTVVIWHYINRKAKSDPTRYQQNVPNKVAGECIPEQFLSIQEVLTCYTKLLYTHASSSVRQILHILHTNTNKPIFKRCNIKHQDSFSSQIRQPFVDFFIYLFFIEMGAPCAFKHCLWYISPFPPWVIFACLYYWKNNIGNRVLIFIKRKSICDQIKIHTVIILKIRCSHLISSIHWD